MDEEVIETIRETSRHLLLLNRRRHRDEVADVRRSMAGLRTNSDIVANIARKLKTKSTVTVSQLHTLKNALMDDAANIELVLHAEGAVRGLVREMTGIDVNKQGAALGCFCNLALGEAKACLIISKAAGPYLVPMLDNMNAELAITSAWTLGNLAGSGKMVCDLLTAQGAIDKLVDLLLKNNEETRESILYALVHFVHQLQNDFPQEHIHMMMFILPSLRMAESIQIFYFLSFHINFNDDFVTPDFVLKGLRYLNVTIQRSHDPQSVAILFRFAANLNSTELYRIFLNYFSNNKIDLLKKLCETENVKDSVLWFLGNAYNCCCTHDVFVELLK